MSECTRSLDIQISYGWYTGHYIHQQLIVVGRIIGQARKQNKTKQHTNLVN